MLADAAQSYLAVRRAVGFSLKEVGLHLKGFAAYSDAQGQPYIKPQTAIEWARQVSSAQSRARRLADVTRFARYLKAEDVRHEIPPAEGRLDHRDRQRAYRQRCHQRAMEASVTASVLSFAMRVSFPM